MLLSRTVLARPTVPVQPAAHSGTSDSSDRRRTSHLPCSPVSPPGSPSAYHTWDTVAYRSHRREPRWQLWLVLLALLRLRSGTEPALVRSAAYRSHAALGYATGEAELLQTQHPPLRPAVAASASGDSRHPIRYPRQAASCLSGTPRSPHGYDRCVPWHRDVHADARRRRCPTGLL